MTRLVHPLITPARLRRMAIIYLRQSSLGQVRDHTGSAAVQSEQDELARAFGFSDVRPIDEDLGKSGSTTERRNGFREVLQLVASGGVGAVFAVNASRLSRQVRAFSELVVLCRYHDTVLVLDGRPRDPNNPQDVAMLHVEGAFAELDGGMRTSGLRAARLAKAREGKRVSRLPTGWIIDEASETIAIDPEVSDAIKEVPVVFWEARSARGTVAALNRAGRLLPVRRGSQVLWKRPSIERVLKFLLHPAYAGLYEFGKTESVLNQPPRANGHSARRPVPEDQWIRLPDYYPAYMTPEEQERIRGQLRRNAFMARHRPGRGAALCQGALVCGKCGYTLTVADPRPRRFSHYYQCTVQASRYGMPSCISIQGRDLDTAIEGVILSALSAPPLAVLTSALADARSADRAREASVEAERQRLLYEERRARDRYENVDARNRRVAALLEEQLEEAIGARAGFEQRLAAEPPRPPVDGTEEELRELCRIAADVPQLFRHPLVTDRDREDILRCLIDRIVVDANDDAVEGVIMWASGAQTTVRVWRRRGLRRLIRERHAEGMTVRQIQVWLGNGDPETGQRWIWTRSRIYQILRQLGLHPHPSPRGVSVDRLKVQQLYDQGLTLREIVARLNAEGYTTALGKWWTPNAVWHWLGRRGRRAQLEELHGRALADAKRRRLTNREAAEEFNIQGLPRVGRRPWTADGVRQRRAHLTRRAWSRRTTSETKWTENQRGA